MSGFKGDNLIEESTNMSWYSGFTVKPKKKEVSGKTLLNALNDVVHVPKRPTKEPLRMPVSGVYKIKGVGDVIIGRVEQGTLKPGPNVVFAPTGVSGKCFSIGNLTFKKYDQSLGFLKTITLHSLLDHTSRLLLEKCTTRPSTRPDLETTLVST